MFGGIWSFHHQNSDINWLLQRWEKDMLHAQTSPPGSLYLGWSCQQYPCTQYSNAVLPNVILMVSFSIATIHLLFLQWLSSKLTVGKLMNITVANVIFISCYHIRTYYRHCGTCMDSNEAFSILTMSYKSKMSLCLLNNEMETTLGLHNLKPAVAPKWDVGGSHSISSFPKM